MNRTLYSLSLSCFFLRFEWNHAHFFSSANSTQFQWEKQSNFLGMICSLFSEAQVQVTDNNIPSERKSHHSVEVSQGNQRTAIQMTVPTQLCTKICAISSSS